VAQRPLARRVEHWLGRGCAACRQCAGEDGDRERSLAGGAAGTTRLPAGAGGHAQDAAAGMACCRRERCAACAGGTQRLPGLIGLPQAARLILGGGLVTASQALHLGLVDAVLPEQGFLDAALDWAAPFAAQTRHSLFAAKLALVRGTNLTLNQGRALEQGIFRTVLASSETRAMSAQADPR
jgi:enoyl-CoA hydratase/carnithine racemase